MKNLYYTEDGTRVKILKVFTSGKTIAKTKRGCTIISNIGDLKRVQ
jgi:hypothetical protein